MNRYRRCILFIDKLYIVLALFAIFMAGFVYGTDYGQYVYEQEFWADKY